MDIGRRHEARKALTALDTRNRALIDKLQDLKPRVYELPENIRLLRAEREHVSKRVAPIHLLPDEVLASLGRVVDGLDVRIEELENTLSNVDAQVRRVEQEVRVLGEERKQLASLMAPVHLLPDELLADIWSHVRAPELYPDYDGIPFSYVASWVSSRWRSVAIDTAGSWRDIYVSPYRSIELVKTQLDRSKSCSLNLWVTGDNYHDRTIHIAGRPKRQQKMRDLMLVVAACAHRCYSLEVNVSGAGYLETILPPLRDAFAPQLKYLYLRFPRLPYLEPLFIRGAPNLSHVDFHNMSISSNLTLLRGLTRLDLGNIPAAGWASYAEFQSLLAACPDLTTLSIYGRCFDPGPTIGYRSSICIPSLVSLRFCLKDSKDDFISDLFNAFSAPALKRLILVEFRSEAYEAFVNVMRISTPSSRYPILSKLSLYGAIDDTWGNVLLLLTLFPHIDKLDLICGGGDLPHIMEVLTLSTAGEIVNGGEPVCPRVTTLTCPAWCVSDKSIVRKFITTRASMGYPISVVFDARSALRDSSLMRDAGG